MPSILLLVFGVALRRSGQVDAHFCMQASKLVFNYGLPCLLFVNLFGSEIHYGEQILLLLAGAAATLVLFFGAELYAWRFVPAARDKGVFVQACFAAIWALWAWLLCSMLMAARAWPLARCIPA